MSKKEEKTPQDINSKPFYKKASFPWAIIVSIAIAVAAFIGGWHASQAQNADIKAQAVNLAETFVKKDAK